MKGLWKVEASNLACVFAMKWTRDIVAAIYLFWTVFEKNAKKYIFLYKYTKNQVNDDSKTTEIRKNIYQTYKLNLYIKTVVLKFENGIHDTF